jgi:DNA-directed RNA polymerase
MTTGAMQFENDMYEAGMKAKAVKRHERKAEKAAESDRQSTAEPHQGMLRGIVRAGVAELDKTLSKRGAGRPNVGLVRLRESGVGSKRAIFIGAVSVLDGIAAGHALQPLCKRVGRRIEDERNFRAFKKASPRLYKWMLASLKERGSQDYRFKRRVVLNALHRATDDIPFVQWSDEDRARVGVEIVKALSATGLFLKSQVGAGKAARVFLRLTPEAEDRLRDRDDLVRLLCRPWFKPTLTPPMDWVSPTEGGYHTAEMRLVKSPVREYTESLRSADMPDVYATVNALQRTAWQVSDEVHGVALYFWKRRLPIAGLPAAEDMPFPARPGDLPDHSVSTKDFTPEETDVFKRWKGRVTAWHNARHARASLVAQTTQILEISDELGEKDEFYFPHQLDYRGRAYAVPLLLNPQGSDFARGLLAFAKAKPLGATGGYWLAVHGANTWAQDVTVLDEDTGEETRAALDKLPLEERVEWTMANSQMFCEIARDPIGDQRWTEADAPWQFLAFCFEWNGYIQSGESPEFESRLPVSIDGSCNGLQHFAAMLRDEPLARTVNLLPLEQPEDVYQRVAERVTAKVRALDDGTDSTEARLARGWLAYGLDTPRIARKTVKRQVMTTPYGVSRTGMREQLDDEVGDALDAEMGARAPALNLLNGVIFDAIQETVTAASTAMTFLQAMARKVSERDLPLRWVTPVGFPVLQACKKVRKYRIDTQLLGRLQIQFVQDTDELDRRKQVTALAPNFVHSYDAAHLCRTVVALEAERGHGLDWAVVHDSFGTHAADVEDLGRVLRRTFVDLYQGHSPLAAFAAQVEAVLPAGTGLPEVPESGALDLEQVLAADFFFA